MDVSKEGLKSANTVEDILDTNMGEEKKAISMYRAFSIASSPTENFLLFTARIRAESIYKQRLNALN